MLFKMIISKLLRPLIGMAFFSLLFASPALAVNYAWNGGPAGDWDVPANWSPEPPAGPGVPGPGDAVFFESDATVTLVADRVVTSVFIDTANVSFDGGGTNSLTTTTLQLYSSTSLTMSNAGDHLYVTNSLDLHSNALTLNGPGQFTVQGSGTIDCGATGYLELDNSAKLNLNGNQTIRFITGTGSWGNGTEISLSNGRTLTLTNDTGLPNQWGNYMGVISGNGNLALAFTDRYSLTVSKTYTGWTRVISGDLELYGGSNILPSTTFLQVYNGAQCSPAEQTVAGISGAGTIEIWNDDTLTVNQAVSSTFSGDIDDQGGSGELHKTGTGRLTLTGTVRPEVHVNNGTLVINGTVQSNTARVNGGTLLGNGTVGMLALNSGVVSPGNSIGTLSTTAGSSMNAGGTYWVEVSGGAADRLDVVGLVHIDGTTLRVSGLPVKGARYTIINNDSNDAVTGALFNGLAEGDTFRSGKGEYEISYAGGTGNDVVLTCLKAFPDPAPDPGPTPTPDPRPTPDVGPADSPSPTGSLNGPVISWPKVGGTNHYNVYRAACPTCPKTQVGRVAGTSFTDETALPGQVYYYFIRSDNGALSGYSDWIPAWRFEQNPGRAGDFNGDGIMDLLWWDPDTGQITIWFMNAGAVQSVSAPFNGLDISQWLLVNTGDFNNDGTCDLLWWNPETGEALVWYLDAMISASSGYAPSNVTAGDITGNVTLSYKGDLNGDGKADLLWRDYATGDLTVWLMGEDGAPSFNGPPTLSEQAQGITDEGRPGLTGSLEWTLRGLYDMNADQKADVVWQHGSDGRVVVWLMDGAEATSFNQYQRTEPENWRIVGMGDLNGDSLADIVWRNDVTGQVRAWIMTGADSQAEPAYEEHEIAMGEDALSWQVKAVGDFCAPGCDDVYCKHAESSAVRIIKLDGREFTPTVE